MKPSLYSCLYTTIDNWIEEHSDTVEWPSDFYLPDNLVKDMTEAATLIFDAMVDSQGYAAPYRDDDEDFARE